MCKDEFREKLENFDLKAEAPFLFWAIAKNRYTWSRFTQKQVQPTIKALFVRHLYGVVYCVPLLRNHLIANKT